MRYQYLVLLLLICAGTSDAKVVTVALDGTGDFSSIRKAVFSASGGDTVVLYPGVYTGEDNRGVYLDDLNIRSIDPLDPNVVRSTVMDCNSFSEYSQAKTNFGSYRAFNTQGQCSVSGLTIMRGCAPYGGAIWYDGDYDSYMTISHCRFINNYAAYGGGAMSSPGNYTVSHCLFKDNIAEEKGGAIYCPSGLSANLKVENCLLVGNQANQGGAIWLGRHAHGTVNHCTVVANTAYESGGGLYIGDATPYCSPFSIRNSVLWYNRIARYVLPPKIPDNPRRGRSLALFADDKAQYIEEDGPNAQLAGGPPSLSFCCIQSDAPDAFSCPSVQGYLGNINDPPMFVQDPCDHGDGWIDNPDANDIDEGANNDYGDLHLRLNSPCIDVGDPNYVPKTTYTDVDGQYRLMGTSVDVGYDEFPIPSFVTTKPTGGETWASGSYHSIGWLSYAYQGPIDVQLYQRRRWITLAHKLPNSGETTIQLPKSLDAKDCMIQIIPSEHHLDAVSKPSGPFAVHPDKPDAPVTAHWKTLGGDFQRTGLADANGPGLGPIEWFYHTGSAVATSTTIGKQDRIHIACLDGKLHTIDLQGKLIWIYDCNSPLISSPSIGPDGSIYVGSEEGRLYAISPQGALKWTYSSDGSIYSSPAVLPDGRVLVGSLSGKLQALSRDGSELRTFSVDPPKSRQAAMTASPTLGPDQTIYIGNLHHSTLYALDPNGGEAKWSHRFASGGWPFTSPVLSPDGVIYQVLLFDSHLYALDAENGEKRWELDLADPDYDWLDPNNQYSRHHYDGLSEPVISSDGTLYVCLDDAHIRAVTPQGHIKWGRRLGWYTELGLISDASGRVYAAGRERIQRSYTDGEREYKYYSYLSKIFSLDINGQLAELSWEPHRYSPWVANICHPVIGPDNSLICTGTNDDSHFNTSYVVFSISDRQ